MDSGETSSSRRHQYHHENRRRAEERLEEKHKQKKKSRRKHKILARRRTLTDGAIDRANDRLSDSSDVSDFHFQSVNERPVEDISIEFFYKPHTLTLLAVAVILVFYTALIRSALPLSCNSIFELFSSVFSDDSYQEDNIWRGLKAIVFFVVVVSVLTFPNGKLFLTYLNLNLHASRMQTHQRF